MSKRSWADYKKNIDSDNEKPRKVSTSRSVSVSNSSEIS